MLPLPLPVATELPDTPGTEKQETQVLWGEQDCNSFSYLVSSWFVIIALCQAELQCEPLLLVPGCCSPGEYTIIPPFPFPLVDGTDASRPERDRTGSFSSSENKEETNL